MTTDSSTASPSDAAPDLLRELDHDACLRLLGATPFGRLAVVSDGRPRMVLLNYIVDEGDLLFRTRDRDLAARLTVDGIGCEALFEIDSAFPQGRSGWSVMAAGRLIRETDPVRIAKGTTGIDAWARGERDTVIRLVVTELTGRQVGLD